MGKPIKISDQLYQRLKSQADSQGLTLQDALVELITTPHEGLTALQSQVEASHKVTTSQRKSQLTQQAELKKVRNEVASLRGQITQLSELLVKEIEALSEWVEIWEEIDPLSTRVSALEKISHSHFWQVVEEDE